MGYLLTHKVRARLWPTKWAKLEVEVPSHGSSRHAPEKRFPVSVLCSLPADRRPLVESGTETGPRAIAIAVRRGAIRWIHIRYTLSDRWRPRLIGTKLYNQIWRFGLSAIIFDTSGINGLEDAGEASGLIMRGLFSGFDVILTASSAEEIMATGTPARREALLSRLDWLLTSAKCIWPAQEVIRLLISTHKNTPVGFDWRKVDVRARVYENAISRRAVDDALCAEQRHHQFRLEKKFKKMWTGLRKGLDAILANDPSKRPTSYQDAVAIAERDGGVLWTFAKWLYKPIAKTEPTEEEIKSFVEVCPPFRAACYGLVMAWYNWSLRVQDGTATAGRNDLMMAAYLPYCGRFVTNDWAQTHDLYEVAIAACIECEVLSLKELEQNLLIPT